MAALVQTASGSSIAGGTSVAVPFPSSVGSGSLLVGYVACGGSLKTLTCSDSRNGTWGAANVLSNGACGIFTFPNAAAGATTVTATVSTAVGVVVIIEEWSGVQALTPLDQTANQHGGQNPSASTGTTAPLAQVNELACAIMSLTGNGGSGFTCSAPFSPSTAGPVQLAGGSYILMAGNNQPNSTSGVSATFSFANTFWNGAIATYKLAGGALAPEFPSKLFFVLP
jgi:hypothetical protein